MVRPEGLEPPANWFEAMNPRKNGFYHLCLPLPSYVSFQQFTDLIAAFYWHEVAFIGYSADCEPATIVARRQVERSPRFMRPGRSVSVIFSEDPRFGVEEVSIDRIV